jgi:CDP-diacylglycerol--serine O-phosphatidyltransferase
MQRPRRQRLKGLPLNRMIPNMLTLLALSAGMTAIRFGLQERWEPAVLALVAAAVLDGLDGRVARALKGTSKFGAELDSLSDFICFGVAPRMLLYLWAMESAGRLGWIIVVLYSICCALRLARFNTKLDEPDLPPWAYNFFSGVPAPMAAGLVVLPMMISFQIDHPIFRQPEVVAGFLIAVSGLMISRIPTFAFKKTKIPNAWVLPTMLFVGLYATSMVSAPWLTFSATMAVYAVSIPLSVRSFHSLRKQAEDIKRKTPPAEPPAT